MDVAEFDPKKIRVKDLRLLAEERGRLGFVAQANADGTAGQVHWTQASKTADGKWNQRLAGETRKTEEKMIASLFEGLPEVRRRTAEERFRVLFDRLVEQAMVSYRERGYPVWPKSIEVKLFSLGWKPADPDVYGQCAALARQLFIEAGHKQKEKDQRKVTLDWHGGYNHAVEFRADAKSGLAAPASANTPAAS